MSNNGVKQVDANYCFNLVNSLIDYKGDIARGSNSKITYSKDYSPNNIRRLIISGDGAVVHFHTKIGGSLSKIKPFSDKDKVNMQYSMSLEKYKPMLWVLAERVCASVEEIVICTQNRGNIDLSRELDFSGLLKSKSNVTNVKNSIMERYPRLAYFTIVNCDANSLLNNKEVIECSSPYKLISETNFVKSIGNITKFNNDWFNNYGHHSVYSMDDNGGTLNTHFKTVKAEFEKRRKDSIISDLKNSRLKEVHSKFSKPFSNYSGVYNCIKNLSIILNTEGLNYISKDLELLNVKLPASPDKLKDDFYKLSDENKCKELINYMINSSTSMYSLLSDWFFKSILSVKLNYAVTCNLLLTSVDRRIVVPPNCKDVVSRIGHSFEGKDMASSVANICSYACSLFVTDVGEHDMSKYYSKNTWLKNFEGGK